MQRVGYVKRRLSKLTMPSLSKEKLLIITALSLVGVSLTVSIVLGLQVIKLKQDLAHLSFPTLIPTATPIPKFEFSPIPSPEISPTPVSETKLPPATKETSLSCDKQCKDLGFVFGYCGTGYDESLSKEELKRLFNVKNVDYILEKGPCGVGKWGHLNPKDIGKTHYCDKWLANEGFKKGTVSHCCCISACLSDDESCGYCGKNGDCEDHDCKYCCSDKTHKVPTACGCDLAGNCSCQKTIFCGPEK